MGKPINHYELVENRIGQDERYSVNPKKLKELGWTPQMNLDEYLPDLIKRYKNKNEK